MQIGRFLGCALLFLTGLCGQDRLQLASPAALSRADVAAVSAAGRKDGLSCAVEHTDPELGLDLRFRTGFTASIPLQRLTPGVGEVRTLVRVTPAGNPAGATFFSSRTPVPDFDSTGGQVEVSRQFAVGAGRYRVDLLNAYGDAQCVEHWSLEAKMRRQFAAMPPPIPPGVAQELSPDPFYDSPRPSARSAGGLSVKLLVNFSPAGLDSTLLAEDDIRGILNILHTVAREPRFGRFSVVAFSSDQERVLLRAPASRSIDFRALGGAVRKLRSGTISLSQLADRESSTRFLSRLLTDELTDDSSGPDAVVVISPKVNLDQKLSNRPLAERAHLHCPVFLLSYNPDPLRNPWRGVLARAIVGAYRGVEWTVSKPADLSKAILNLRSQLPPAGR
jgi:hypothetical protein